MVGTSAQYNFNYKRTLSTWLYTSVRSEQTNDLATNAQKCTAQKKKLLTQVMPGRSLC